MSALTFKSFVWPQNPQVYQEKALREAHFSTQSGVKNFDGMGDLQRIITGRGCFCGADAYSLFKQLLQLMEEETPGNLEHPVWGVRYCYLTGLELVQEPGENVVEYTFEFTQALANGEVPT